jgi:hypothetical protein
LKRGATVGLIRWNEVDAIDFLAVDRHCIDFVWAVGGSHCPSTRQAIAHEVDADHASPERCPLALHPQNPTSEIECEVVAAMLSDGLEDVDP